MKGVVDTDILLKLAHYGLLSLTLRSLDNKFNEVGILGAATFMIRRRLKDSKIVADLDLFLSQIKVIEPDANELAFAAEIEFQATSQSVDLDEGESILCAVVVNRALQWLATGDKRAIVALENLIEEIPDLSKLAGKILCLEAVVLGLLQLGDPQEIRSTICNKPRVDQALTICFSCASPASSQESWVEGLGSYVTDLRKRAPTVLMASTWVDS